MRQQLMKFTAGQPYSRRWEQTLRLVPLLPGLVVLAASIAIDVSPAIAAETKRKTPSAATSATKPAPTFTPAQRFAAIQSGNIRLRLTDVTAIDIANQMRTQAESANDLLAFVKDATTRRRIAEAIAELSPQAKEALGKSPKGVALGLVLVESTRVEGEAGANESRVKSRQLLGVGEPGFQALLMQALAVPPAGAARKDHAKDEAEQWRADPAHSVAVSFTLDQETLKAGVIPYTGLKAAMEQAADKQLVEAEAAKNAREAKKAAEAQKLHEQRAAELAREQQALKDLKAREALEKEIERREKALKEREERERQERKNRK